MNADDVCRLIAAGESMEVEFKSDIPPLSSADTYGEVVALANHEGGVLLVGAEDHGLITGAQPRGGDRIQSEKMDAAIFNNTVPPVAVRTSVVEISDQVVVGIEVPRSESVVATAAGVCKRRALGGDGRPASVPYPPIQQTSRRFDATGLDYSAARLSGATLEDLDPVEIDRVRGMVRRLNGDAALLELDSTEFVKALRAVDTIGAVLIPNVTGLLMFGREDSIARLVPTHEVRFQVLGPDSGVLVNEVYRGPIGRTLEEIAVQFAARNREQEISVGLFRLPVPDYAPEGFRESLNNAILHRDYARLESVNVQFQPDSLTITNPGGFPRGVTTENLLVHEPQPRNPRLAEVFRRIGLVEQTGRGVDRIYAGQLRYGRPLPDYSRTDFDTVRLVLRGGDGSLEFAEMVYEENDTGGLSLDQMIALNTLFHERRTDAHMVAGSIQKSPADARAILEALVERGLAEARGVRRSREYILSGAMYRRLHMKSEYVRGRGFDRIQQEQMVLTYVREHGRITRAVVADLCGLDSKQAKALLLSMRDRGLLVLRGERRGARYELPLAE